MHFSSLECQCCLTVTYWLLWISRPFNSNNSYNKLYCARNVHILRWHMKLTVTITTYAVPKNMIIYFRVSHVWGMHHEQHEEHGNEFLCRIKMACKQLHVLSVRRENQLLHWQTMCGKKCCIAASILWFPSKRVPTKMCSTRVSDICDGIDLISNALSHNTVEVGWEISARKKSPKIPTTQMNEFKC